MSKKITIRHLLETKAKRLMQTKSDVVRCKMKELLKMENIEKSFPGVKALSGVNLVLKKGELNALVGENGAGKSTLMKILAGVHQKDGGKIFMEGKEDRKSVV